jgi:S1/P1 Nuclease
LFQFHPRLGAAREGLKTNLSLPGLGGKDQSASSRVWCAAVIGHRTFDKLADDLRGNLTTYKGHPAASGTMMDWMKETHQAGIDTAYDGLSNGDDIAGVYIGHALPVVQQQLLNAGIRLAKIIDENF